MSAVGTIAAQVMLCKTSAVDNNNKFYEVTLYSDGRVTTRWGRVGSVGQSKQLGQVGGAGFAAAVARKEDRGYRRIDTPSAASLNGTDVIRDAAHNALADGAAATDELIELLARQNSHAIEVSSGGLITPSAGGGMQTELGPVSARAVAEARRQLDRATQGDIGAVDEYLMLVPQRMPRERGWQSRFGEPDFVTEQREFLDQLDAAVAMGATGATASFRYRLTVVEDSCADVAELQTRFAASRDSHHLAARLRLHRVWALTDTTGHDGWTKLRGRLGAETVRDLWHGTRTVNVLSILHRGLYVPPFTGTSVNTHGRMFGDGLYFSDLSTKSLNYSHGSWSRDRGLDNRCFMLSAQVVMGRELRTRPGDDRHDVVRRMRSGRPRHNSLVVVGGTCGVHNNEMVIPDGAQVLLRHLCEFRR